MNLKSIVAVLLTVSVASAVQHQYTCTTHVSVIGRMGMLTNAALRMASKEGQRTPALKSEQSVLELRVDESRTLFCLL